MYYQYTNNNYHYRYLKQVQAVQAKVDFEVTLGTAGYQGSREQPYDYLSLACHER